MAHSILPNLHPSDTAEPSRRVVLKQMAVLLGISLTADAICALAQTPEKNKLLLLSQSELLLTGTLAELIIPTTETPGALAANVHLFIDQFLVECRSKADQKKFLSGLARINRVSRENFQKDFVQLKPEQQTQLLIAIEKTQPGFAVEDRYFFKQLKSLVILGYYTSEIGATQELAYLAIPGGYQGHFPFSKIGKAWALTS